MTMTAPRSAQGQADAPVPAPAPRMHLRAVAPDVYDAMFAFAKAAGTGLDPEVAHLIKVYASGLNGCAFCLDMHVTGARADGTDERKLFGVTAWRDTPFFTARERAALALTEEITRLGPHGVQDAVYDEAAALFDEPELARVVATAVAINSWNRLCVTTRLTPPAGH